MEETNTRDLRSESVAYMRFRNVSAKYSHSGRLIAGDAKDHQGSNARGHNVTPKPGHSRRTYGDGHTGRVARAADASMESRDEASRPEPAALERALSQSMLDDGADAGILYSFEKRRSSPNADGANVALDALVDKAEEKWESERTDRMIKEYEVLDWKGKKVQISSKKGKERASQSQEEAKGGAVEDEDFEVV